MNNLFRTILVVLLIAMVLPLSGCVTPPSYTSTPTVLGGGGSETASPYRHLQLGMIPSKNFIESVRFVQKLNEGSGGEGIAWVLSGNTYVSTINAIFTKRFKTVRPASSFNEPNFDLFILLDSKIYPEGGTNKETKVSITLTVHQKGGVEIARIQGSGEENNPFVGGVWHPEINKALDEAVTEVSKALDAETELLAFARDRLQAPRVMTAKTKRFPLAPHMLNFSKGVSRLDDVAVIIGNADYEKGKDIPNVIPAYADAASIKNYVTQALGIREENIIYLKDAAQSELAATFGSKDNPKGQLFNYVKPGKSRVFVYYSGHGAPGGENGSSYIVPADAQSSLIDLNGYPLSTLYKNLGKIPAKSITVVLEACFSGASQSGSVIAHASPIYLKAKETTIPPNITVIAAGAANQIASWEQDSSNGLFTKYFLKGMSGEADAAPYGNGDGKVGYDELAGYFKDTITYFARRYYGRDQKAQIVVGKSE